MRITPENDSVLCDAVDGEQADSTGLYIPDCGEFKTYRIIASASQKYCIGDRIVTNSTGTKMKFENSVQYLFREENIIGKVID